MRLAPNPRWAPPSPPPASPPPQVRESLRGLTLEAQADATPAGRQAAALRARAAQQSEEIRKVKGHQPIFPWGQLGFRLLGFWGTAEPTGRWWWWDLA